MRDYAGARKCKDLRWKTSTMLKILTIPETQNPQKVCNRDQRGEIYMVRGRAKEDVGTETRARARRPSQETKHDVATDILLRCHPKPSFNGYFSRQRSGELLATADDPSQHKRRDENVDDLCARSPFRGSAAIRLGHQAQLGNDRRQSASQRGREENSSQEAMMFSRTEGK